MIDFGDGPTIGWRERQRLARKSHACGECGRFIATGDRYWYASGVSNGRGFSAKTCEHCHVITDWLSANCQGYIYGGQVEDFQDHAEACLPMLRLVVGARRQWKAFQDPALLLPLPVYPEDMVA
jgi:hypothetical protein